MIKKYMNIVLILYIIINSHNAAYIPIYKYIESNCNLITCPSQQGYCKSDQCNCYKGYLTFRNNVDSDFKYCNYKQKHSLTALLLETFGLIGFGHFYSGRILSGIIKLVCFYFIICYGTQFVIQFMKETADSDIAYYIKIIICCICLGTPIVWHFIDLFNWSNNNYLDGNGMKMIRW